MGIDQNNTVGSCLNTGGRNRGPAGARRRRVSQGAAIGDRSPPTMARVNYNSIVSRLLWAFINHGLRAVIIIDRRNSRPAGRAADVGSFDSSLSRSHDLRGGRVRAGAACRWRISRVGLRLTRRAAPAAGRRHCPLVRSDTNGS
ncbi:hypothetical protein EVAR_94733_1 [Eumeta japonica]|uniref:Uncharacterized protein n=1 Tax=Eumeta variegata TaxID=151549 RepID=A0A4C1UVN6_EUMVA|nr:hypothetical protein EVAR_94733_1 [Eumeta japonica]